MPPAPQTPQNNQPVNFGALSLQSQPITVHPAVAQALPSTPDGFKAMVVAAHPDGTASDGRKYADIPAQELLQKVVEKYPSGVASDGRAYSSFMPKTTSGFSGPSSSPLANLGANVASATGKLPEQAAQADLKVFGPPTAGLADALGTSIASIKAFLQGNPKLAAQIANDNAPDITKTAGSAAATMAIPASLALGGGAGSSWWGRILNAGLKYGAAGGTISGGTTASQGGNASDIAASTATGAATGFLGGAAGQGVAEGWAALKTPTPDIMKIQDTIAPKLNAKETQSAINEGRVARGSDSFLFGKRPDTVVQSLEVQTASHTIQDTIPGAAKMNDVQLSQALDAKINSTAEALRPEMQAVPLHPSTTGRMFDAWDSLQTEQQSAPEFLDNEAGNKAFQGKFKNYLDQMQWDVGGGADGFKSPTPKTMNDAWDTRIAYDNSIPANVKNATEASSPILQFRKTMWLQNRAILNGVISDSSVGLGDAAKEPFANMSDMYMARQNIASKAKIDITGTPGILPFDKKTLLKWGLGVGGGALGLHYLGGKVGLPI